MMAITDSTITGRVYISLCSFLGMWIEGDATAVSTVMGNYYLVCFACSPSSRGPMSLAAASSSPHGVKAPIDVVGPHLSSAAP